MDQEQAAWEAKTEAAPGLTIAQARTWFDQVQNPNNWKYPVDHIFTRPISADDRRQITAAIIHFTGSVAEWARIGNTQLWRVRAAGYYRTVGA